MKRPLAAAPALAAMLIGFVVLFRDALFRGAFVIIGDPLRQLYPLRTVAWQMIRDGVPPLWTPHLLSGYPLSAMVMLGITYPVTWGYAFLPGWWAEQIYVLAPYFLAPLFTWLFLRELGRSTAAAVLGALTFGYGGFLFSTIGLTGVHANSALWMPLLLLGVARARRSAAVPALLISTFAYVMSILAGSGQMFLYAGGLAVVYGAFLTFRADAPSPRWRPFLVAVSSIVLGAGLTAWQIAETWVATSVSVRRAYPPERFVEGSFSAAFAWQALVQPLGNYWDSSTYVAALAVLAALVATVAAFRRPRVSSETFFWVAVAAIAWLLILGNNTPLFALYSRIPFVSRFRYPSRHTLEWSFAVAVLAAQGWDLAAAWLARFRIRFAAVVGGVCVLIAAFIAWRWLHFNVANGLEKVTDLNLTSNGVSDGYVAFKFAFTVAMALACASFAALHSERVRNALLGLAFTFACLVEPWFWLVRPVIGKSSVPVAQFSATAGSTRILGEITGPHKPLYRERVFSAAHPYAVDPGQGLEAPNWTVLAGLHEANGYESLIQERYSLALRGVVDGEPFIYPDPTILDPKSHVLDLLNVRFLTSFTDFGAFMGSGYIAKDDIAFGARDLMLDLSREVPANLFANGFDADTLLLVSTMANSVPVTQGEPVAKAVFHLTGGGTLEQPILAGIHTAEWAYDRDDVRPMVQHERAPLFDSAPADPQGSFQSHRFLARIPLGQRVNVASIDLVKVVDGASVGVWKATLYDSTRRRSRTLPEPFPERWRTIYDENEIAILENRRLLPRAWLVPTVRVAEPAEVLRLIREGGDAFDPRKTALLEEASQAPALPDQPLAAGASARVVTYEPVRIRVETDSARPAFLVVSELYYPGWVATVDGSETPIHRADYLLRGVPVPAGKHVVEMRFTVPAAKRGAVVSLTALMLIGALLLFHRRQLRRARA